MTTIENTQQLPAPSRELISILKAAAVLLAINLFFGLWFWISPNFEEVVPAQQSEIYRQMNMAAEKPSPFYYVQPEGKRKTLKALKLRPVLVQETSVAERHPGQEEEAQLLAYLADSGGGE